MAGSPSLSLAIGWSDPAPGTMLVSFYKDDRQAAFSSLIVIFLVRHTQRKLASKSARYFNRAFRLMY
jgi:hypothetical protein